MDPPPPGQGRLHARARELREQGLDYEEIAAALGVSKSSVSLWVRDMPRPERLSYEECRKRSAEGSQRYWDAERPLREARREAVRAAAAGRDRRSDQTGDPHRRGDRLLVRGRQEQAAQETGSRGLHQQRSCADQVLPALSRRGRCRPRRPGSACTSTRRPMWRERNSSGRGSRADPAQFHRTALKRHNPRTVRKNVGADYHGCLIVERQAERRPLPADRRLGRRDHGRSAGARCAE